MSEKRDDETVTAFTMRRIRDDIIEECAKVAEHNYALMFTKQENRDAARKVSAQIAKGIRDLVGGANNG